MTRDIHSSRKRVMTFATWIAIIVIVVPVAALTATHDGRVIPGEYAGAGNPAEFEKNDRIVDIDEFRMHDIGSILERAPVLADGGLEYITSFLWSDLNDMYMQDGIIFCAFTYGLKIMDARQGVPFSTISTLYLHTSGGGATNLEKWGEYIYIAREEGVVVIDVSDLEHPFVTGSYPSQGDFTELTCADDVLYLVDRESGYGGYTYSLTILDVSDPGNPALLSRRTDLGGYPRHVAVMKDIAFIPAGSEFHILDVSDPANPTVLASRELYNVLGAVLSDSLAFAFKSGHADSLIILNLSDPADPAIIGVHASSDPDCARYGMILVDSLLITGGEIINVSNPSEPVSMSTYYTTCRGHALAVWNNNLYNAEHDLISIHSIADPEEPFLVDYHPFPSIQDVCVRGDLAYVATVWGLVILDISDIHHPVVIGELEDWYDNYCIDVHGDILCIGGDVVDISDPANPAFIANLGYDHRDVRLKDNLAYMLRGFVGPGTLLVFDLFDPSNPELLSTYEVEVSHHAKIAMKDTLAFLPMSPLYNSSESVHIINYANPSFPELIGTYGDKASMVVAVDGDIMYTCLSSDLHVVDIHDPRNPTLIGIFDEFRLWIPIVMVPHRDHLYTTDMYGNTVVFDVSDPTNPLFVENFKTPSVSAENIFTVGDIVFLADRVGLMMLHTPYGAPPALPVCFDIKPGSCPNPLNWKINANGKAVLPAAILGSDDLDVHDIDVTSVRLLDDIAPVRYGYEDVAAPAGSAGGECACTEAGPDGYCDLTLKFDRRSVLERLHAMPEADQYIVTVTGLLANGERIEGHDCVHPVGGRAGGADAMKPVADGGADKTSPLADAAAGGVTIRGNYPNPFNPTTEISFSLPEGSRVTLDIYNSAGQRVVTLADRYYSAGDHTVSWDGRGASGQHVGSGVYFCHIRTGTTVVTKKLLLLR